jgi:hypothetical protein
MEDDNLSKPIAALNRTGPRELAASQPISLDGAIANKICNTLHDFNICKSVVCLTNHTIDILRRIQNTVPTVPSIPTLNSVLTDLNETD